MIVEKSTLKTEVIFSKDKKYRYLLRKEWDKAKPKAMVLMISPSSAGDIALDTTTQLVVNNLSRLDFGGADIVNLYPTIGKLSVRNESDEARLENLKMINQCADKVTKIILAYGSIGNSNKSASKRIEELLSSLEAYKDKVMYLTDVGGEKLFHPLVPSVRLQWELIPYFKENNND